MLVTVTFDLINQFIDKAIEISVALSISYVSEDKIVTLAIIESSMLKIPLNLSNLCLATLKA